MVWNYDAQIFRVYNRCCCFFCHCVSFHTSMFSAIFVAMLTFGIGSKGPTEETLLLNGMLDFPIGLS